MNALPTSMISDDAILSSAREHGIEPALVKAVIYVETPAPHLGDSRYGPLILWERHKFYLYSGRYPASRDYPTLSNPRAGGYCTGRTWEDRQRCEHEKLKLGMSIYGGACREAALKSISMGLFQIMGFNYRLIDQPSVEAMWQRYTRRDDRYDLEDFFRFCTNARLIGYLRTNQIVSFVRGYNGPNYAINQYDRKLITYRDQFRREGLNATPAPMTHSTASGFPDFSQDKNFTVV